MIWVVVLVMASAAAAMGASAVNEAEEQAVVPQLQYRPGTPNEVVEMCRQAVIKAGTIHASERDAELRRVDAASAGAMRQTRAGRTAPVEVGMVYSRPSGPVARHGIIECRVDQSGHVALADIASGRRRPLAPQPKPALQTAQNEPGNSNMASIGRSEPQRPPPPEKRHRVAGGSPTQILAVHAKDRTDSRDLKSKLAAAPARPPEGAAAAAFKEPDAQQMLSRARGLLKEGDISGARLVLERAVGQENSTAALLLAQTYDPLQLKAWRVRGISPEPDKARQLYAKSSVSEPTSTGSIQ